jgi:hypothetical protein
MLERHFEAVSVHDNLCFFLARFLKIDVTCQWFRRITGFLLKVLKKRKEETSGI